MSGSNYSITDLPGVRNSAERVFHCRVLTGNEKLESLRPLRALREIVFFFFLLKGTY